MRDIEIQRIMTTNPMTVTAGDTIEQAQSLLESEDVHHLPVVDDGKLVGVISTADMLKCFLMEGGASGAGAASVRTIMATNPVTLGARSSLRDAALRLSAGGFHALPVVEPDRTLLGIVTSSDLISHLLRQLPVNDGSLASSETPASYSAVIDVDVHAAVASAEEMLGRGEDNLLARGLVELRDRNRKLSAACQAAELYIRSGKAAREHSVLVNSLSELRGISERFYL